MSETVYREHILDHYAHPRHAGRLDDPDIVADADDPSCGDQVHIELALDPQGRVEQVAFEGQGCIISMAAASILAEYVEGRAADALAALSEEDMLALVQAPISASRRRCALLPLKTLQAGLRQHAAEQRQNAG